MNKLFCLALFIMATITSFSQNSTKEKEIRTLLALTGSAKLGLQVMNNLINSYKKAYPQLKETSFWDDFAKEFSTDEMINRIVPVYAKYYSEEEIKTLIQFYQSPIGKKVIATMPDVMQESMQIGEAWGKEVSEKLALKIKEANI